VIVAVDGEILAVDTFESTPLFRKVWPKLLTSYVLDANLQFDAEKEPRTCDVAAAEAFLRSAMQAKTADTVARDGLVTTRADGEGLASFSLHESPDSIIHDALGADLDTPDGANRAAGGMGGGMMGGMGRGTGSGTFGGGVHSAAFSQ
jgi:hypothetical protein